jgi:hypothetical protein
MTNIVYSNQVDLFFNYFITHEKKSIMNMMKYLTSEGSLLNLKHYFISPHKRQRPGWIVECEVKR